MELSFEQKLQIQKLDMQIAALPLDKQQQFARGQRELVPKYLAKNAASGLNTTTTLTVVCFDIRIDHSFVCLFHLESSNKNSSWCSTNFDKQYQYECQAISTYIKC